MPEAAVDEDDSPVFFQNNVWLSRQRPVVKAEAKTRPVQKRAQRHLGPGVDTRYAGHIPASPLFAKFVRHHAFTRMPSRTSAIISAI